MPKIPPMSAATAAQSTGIPKRTIQDAIARGHLKAQRLGEGKTAAFMIEQRDLDRWLAKREQKAASA